MKTPNDRLREWNDAIADGERLAADMRAAIMARKDGIPRRVMLALLRFTERWIARGKRWRMEDFE